MALVLIVLSNPTEDDDTRRIAKESFSNYIKQFSEIHPSEVLYKRKAYQTPKNSLNETSNILINNVMLLTKTPIAESTCLSDLSFFASL